MASNNRRERELARAKRQRQAARQQTAHQRQNWVIGAAGAAVLALAAWLIFQPGDDAATAEPTNSPSQSVAGLDYCTEAPGANASPAQFDGPAPTGEISGKYLWTLNTNCGDIVIEMFGNKAPITVGSFEFLTSQKYFDGVPCHRLTTSASGLWVLQCGDPTGTGGGGPGYSFNDENLPAEVENNYPAGTVAMANSGPNTNGSQFFIVYQDTTLGPNYTIFGQVVSGLEMVQELAALGEVTGTGSGNPVQPIGILSAKLEKAGS